MSSSLEKSPLCPLAYSNHTWYSRPLSILPLSSGLLCICQHTEIYLISSYPQFHCHPGSHHWQLCGLHLSSPSSAGIQCTLTHMFSNNTILHALQALWMIVFILPCNWYYVARQHQTTCHHFPGAEVLRKLQFFINTPNASVNILLHIFKCFCWLDFWKESCWA